MKAPGKPVLEVEGKSVVELPTEMAVKEWISNLAKYGDLIGKIAALGFRITRVSVGPGAELHLTVRVPWVPSGQ